MLSSRLLKGRKFLAKVVLKVFKDDIEGVDGDLPLAGPDTAHRRALRHPCPSQPCWQNRPFIIMFYFIIYILIITGNRNGYRKSARWCPKGIRRRICFARVKGHLRVGRMMGQSNSAMPRNE